MSEVQPLGWEEIGSRLREPFAPDDIEWRVAQAGEKNGAPWAKVLAYLTNRAIMQRLDDVVGPGKWWNEYEAGPQGGVICGITISTWDGRVTKWDGAENTEIESVKGGLSDAMKRAAVQWGMGRYLYGLDEGWAECSSSSQRGWRYQPGKDGKYKAFYWQPPRLPDWALPESNKQPAKPAAAKPTGALADRAKAMDAPAKAQGAIPPGNLRILDALDNMDAITAKCKEFKQIATTDNPPWDKALFVYWQDRNEKFKEMQREVFGNE